jgi:hypothetical protein
MSNPVDASHAAFLTILPRIMLHGQVVFRNLKCPDRKANAIAEIVALSWRWFLRLAAKGKDATRFPTALATFAARAVKSGRRLCGQEKAKDVMNPMTQKRQGFRVEPLPSSTGASHEYLYSAPHGQDHHDAFEERLRDNTITPIPDQVQFRIDWPAWLATLTGRERRMIQAMAQNERTSDLSRQFEVSPGRISQLRREFQADWQRFTGAVEGC